MISCQSHLQANPNHQFVRDALNLAIQEAATNVCQNLSPDDNKQNQDVINKSEIKEKKDLKECRLRSGSVPSEKRQKQMDVQSVSTMTGTHPSHKSDKRIEDLDSRSQNAIAQQKPLIQPPAAQKQAPLWKIDRNGYLTSTTLDITTIKYYLISVATRLGMVVMRDLQDIITVKVHKIDSFRCLFMMCLPMGGSDRCVYQLQRYRVGEKGSRVKLVLISGVEEKFDVFKKSFYYELWSNGVLNLSNFQALTLLCFANSGIINQIVMEYKQACLQYEIRTLSSEQQLQSWQSNLMKKLKQSQKCLKQKIFPESVCEICPTSIAANTCIHRIQKNNINQLMFQRILLHEVPVCELYLKLQMQGNKQFHEKRRIILQKYKVKQVFQYLEIDKKLLGSDWLNVGNYGSHADNQQINKFSLLDLGQNAVLWDKLPYIAAVQILDTLNLFASPLENISIISKFSKKLLECFEQRLGGQNAMMDMDNQLPLTIYCTIISKNTQIKPIISFLRQYFEQEDDFESENRTLAALKAAFEYVRLQWIL